jgi:NAD(P)-dependent dehydrogenase (short-subunit alcohol dehydrogenase family)
VGALVTGAGRGLGARIAALLAERGHAVHVTDVDAEAAAAVADRIGGGAFASSLDVRDAAACDAAATSTVARTGTLDVWVNNAGVLHTGPAWEQTPAQRRLMVEVNTLGVVNGTVSAIGAMRAGGGGHVVNVASLAGLVAVPGEAVYSGSKHAVLGFSLSTAADLRLAGIRDIDISCVCPDGIWTPMLHDRLDDPDAALSFSGTLLSVEQVAAAVGGLLDRPRPVTAVPRWRGAQVRLVDAFPGLGRHGLALGVRLGRRTQRRLRRRGVPHPSS